MTPPILLPAVAEIPRDPRADSRYARGKAAFDDAAFEEAAELFEQALSLAPGWVGAWVALASAAVSLGDHRQAERALAEALRLDPSDRHGAALVVARIAGDALPDRAPAAYVATLFDDYADRFETHLTQGLSYTGPADMRDALHAAGFTHARRAMDLGCGTGLCGAALRAVVDWLGGVDLSPRMVAIASAKTRVGKSQAGLPLYDRLVTGDLEAALAGEPDGSLDLVAAADVFIYIGDLAPIFAGVAHALRRGGLLVFTVQRHEGPGAIDLGPDLRFAHTFLYLAAALTAAGFAIVSRAEKSARREKGRAVPGLVMVARRL